VTEEEKTLGGERYVALRTVCRPRDLRGVLGAAKKRPGQDPGVPVAAGGGRGGGGGGLGGERELVFVPYYLRANRGGKGHMRVGLLNQAVVL
jgi:hypothetical protein